MTLAKSYLYIIVAALLTISCKDTAKKPESPIINTETRIDSTKIKSDSLAKQEEESFELTEDNAIDFFYEYQQDLKANKVKITTSLGSFTVELYENVPYHRANFIYLTRKGYFDYTQFHRVVKNFIIQGGNSDDRKTGKKRNEIGRYLLPPDTRKGHKHHRGTISMPSSEMDNPHMLASPYEFFIVVTDPGSYHLDNEYTPFGRVIEGMDVVDKINNQPVGEGDWPMQNIYITKAEVIE
ncbi:peptidylprolyl isomerase [Maribacter confluentis]|uniref:Peptidyl-prolyl cis-trans isomerase n=1 Tax=Maribacter confluentis TaxID=1656093 RepID=A0ABT8RLF3_9FLAO|nr:MULTISPECIES: peptidylprolyl isomerase [Maribacter]MDO1511760.1 peptidylprolyl isomerase [Maribacter confluentis]TVZ15023.1 cyclophilin family peptidyl-prolyl cis-trans isomerase [Maribacter sp. MAR_2009_72]